MNNCKAFVERLIRAVPELSDVYQQHIIEYDVCLPHVFMADVTRFALLQTDDLCDHASLRHLLNFLDAEIASQDRDVTELIAVSFLENLLGEDRALCVLLPMMGQSLRSEARVICGV